MNSGARMARVTSRHAGTGMEIVQTFGWAWRRAIFCDHVGVARQPGGQALVGRVRLGGRVVIGGGHGGRSEVAMIDVGSS